MFPLPFPIHPFVPPNRLNEPPNNDCIRVSFERAAVSLPNDDWVF